MFSRDQGFALPGIEGKTAVVTGCARGIGEAIVMILADQGARVIAVDIFDIGDWGHPEIATYYACDVGDPERVAEVFRRASEDEGPIDFLINNAGILRQASVLDTTLADWESMLRVNLTGAFNTSRAVLPGMVERGFGRIINIGSSAGRQGGGPGLSGYAASKAGIHSLTKSLAKEYAGDGVTVNAIAPAAIHTEMIRDLAGFAGGASLPVGRLGRPEEIAAAVTFLCSAAASFITGEIFDVNGGAIID